MILSWTLSGHDGRIERLSCQAGGKRRRRTVSRVLTVAEVCRRLKKSRRQVYRYVRSGRLRPVARVLGQWLFDGRDVAEAMSGEVPRSLRGFFWDVALSSLSVRAHQDFILGRLLALGDRAALAWLFRTYPKKAVARFLGGRGAEVLDARTWHFWASQLGVRRKRRRRSWRQRGRAWGGVG